MTHYLKNNISLYYYLHNNHVLSYCMSNITFINNYTYCQIYDLKLKVTSSKPVRR